MKQQKNKKEKIKKEKHKIKLKKSKTYNKQVTKLFQYAGTARFAYNWALAKEQEKNYV